MIDRRVAEAAAQLGVELKCNICGSTENRLVRDHNHRTHMIRGILCEFCNSWLGLYEANMYRIVEKGKKAYRKWIATYFDKIETHLKIRTNIRYSCKRTEGGWAKAGPPRRLKGVVY
jgi:hypothetical protein